MAYIAGLALTAIFFLSLHYFTELKRVQKATVTVVVFGVILGAIFFNAHSDKQRQKMIDVVTKFNQNKTLNCNGKEISNKTYTLSTGTYTFIGKKETPDYADMISASECE